MGFGYVLLKGFPPEASLNHVPSTRHPKIGIASIRRLFYSGQRRGCFIGYLRKPAFVGLRLGMRPCGPLTFFMGYTRLRRNLKGLFLPWFSRATGYCRNQWFIKYFMKTRNSLYIIE
jgi:hypothetical protein